MPANRKKKLNNDFFFPSLIRSSLHILTHGAVVIVVHNPAAREHDMILYLPPSRAKIQSYVQYFVTSFKGSKTRSSHAREIFMFFHI
jgi:hypothetical protein